jgi:hypothetical protein
LTELGKIAKIELGKMSMIGKKESLAFSPHIKWKSLSENSGIVPSRAEDRSKARE